MNVTEVVAKLRVGRCKYCKAFSALTGECRRKSPVMFPVPDKQGGINTMGLYPFTAEDRWCCEFIPDQSLN